MKEYVFISYAKEDAKEAAIFNQFLKNSGIVTWIDFEQLLPGLLWKSKIREAIDKSRAIVFLASVHSINKRGYIQSELKYVLEKIAEFPSGDISIIVARLDNTEPKEVELRDRQWIDLFSNSDSGYRRILRSLERNEEQEHRYSDLSEKNKDREELSKTLEESSRSVTRGENKAHHPYVPAPNTTGRLLEPDSMDIYINKVTKEAFIFHLEQIYYDEIDYLQYHYQEHWVSVVMKDGRRLDLGVKIQWLIRPHWEKMSEVMVVRTQNGQSIDGCSFRLLKIGKVPSAVSNSEVRSPMESYMRFRLFRSLIDKLR